MTCSCPFENMSYGEFYMESLQSQPNPGDSILGHCTALTKNFTLIVAELDRLRLTENVILLAHIY